MMCPWRSIRVSMKSALFRLLYHTLSSVSVAEDGAVHITLTNLSLDKDYEIRTILTDYQVNEVKGEIVHGKMHEMNTFETPDQVRVKEFNEVEKTAEGIRFTIPKCSVLHLEVR